MFDVIGLNFSQNKSNKALTKICFKKSWQAVWELVSTVETFHCKKIQVGRIRGHCCVVVQHCWEDRWVGNFTV
jgi:hypothetical protein